MSITLEQEPHHHSMSRNGFLCRTQEPYTHSQSPGRLSPKTWAHWSTGEWEWSLARRRERVGGGPQHSHIPWETQVYSVIHVQNWSSRKKKVAPFSSESPTLCLPRSNHRVYSLHSVYVCVMCLCVCVVLCVLLCVCMWYVMCVVVCCVCSGERERCMQSKTIQKIRKHL